MRSCIALQREDWPAAHRHFAIALPLIEQLHTAPQAFDARVTGWADELWTTAAEALLWLETQAAVYATMCSA